MPTHPGPNQPHPPTPPGSTPARLAALALVCLAFALHPRAGNPPGPVPDAFPLGIAAGDVRPDSATLWAYATHPGTLTFQWSTSGDLANAVTRSIPQLPGVPAKLRIDGLQPGTTYFYQAAADGQTSRTGRFRTPFNDGSLHGLRFGVIGDWRGDLAPYPSIADIPGRQLDLLAALGDTIYADVGSPALPTPPATLDEFRTKHREVLSARNGLNTLPAARESTSLVAVIDDHELMDDFAGGAPVSSDPRFRGEGLISDTEAFRNAIQAFIEFHPIEDTRYDLPGEPRFHGKPRFFRAHRFGRDAAFFLVDSRTFRDAPLPDVQRITDPNQTRAFRHRAFDLDPATGAPLPPRTMLGPNQLEALKTELQSAQDAGVTWKFILLPEPAQEFGALGASDRFEGYARERSELLRLIATRPIDNVVFIAADFHGALVNNLRWQTGPEAPRQPSGAFEVVTSAVAYHKPFADEALDFAAGFNVLPGVNLLDALLSAIGLTNRTAYDALPILERDAVFKDISNLQLNLAELDTLGLDGSDIAAQLEVGSYVAGHTYGWTEFEIDRETQRLTVSIHGIPAYSPQQLPSQATAPTPEIVGRFIVTPKPSRPSLLARPTPDGLELSWIPTPRFILESSTASLLPPGAPSPPLPSSGTNETASSSPQAIQPGSSVSAYPEHS